MNEKKRVGIGKKAAVSRERGDTIVEVLIALAVLGVVLGGAYVVSNRNINLNRASQERLEAVKLAEGQFEKLKIMSSSDPAVYNWNNFCLDTTNAYRADTHASCYVAADGMPVGPNVDPRYHISITNQALSVKGLSGARYKATVTWVSIGGSPNDKIDQYYEVYR